MELWATFFTHPREIEDITSSHRRKVRRTGRRLESYFVVPLFWYFVISYYWYDRPQCYRTVYGTYTLAGSTRPRAIIKVSREDVGWIFWNVPHLVFQRRTLLRCYPRFFQRIISACWTIVNHVKNTWPAAGDSYTTMRKERRERMDTSISPQLASYSTAVIPLVAIYISKALDSFSSQKWKYWE